MKSSGVKGLAEPSSIGKKMTVNLRTPNSQICCGNQQEAFGKVTGVLMASQAAAEIRHKGRGSFSSSGSLHTSYGGRAVGGKPE